jgi:hypothetical protein
MYEDFQLWLYLYGGIVAACSALVAWFGLVSFLRLPGSIYGGLVFVVFGLSALLLSIGSKNSLGNLSGLASDVARSVEAEGVILSPGVRLAGNAYVIELDDGARVITDLRSSAPLQPGDRVSLSVLATPGQGFSVPAICRAGSCWVVSLRRDRQPSVCDFSSAEACLSRGKVRQRS